MWVIFLFVLVSSLVKASCEQSDRTLFPTPSWVRQISHVAIASDQSVAELKVTHELSEQVNVLRSVCIGLKGEAFWYRVQPVQCFSLKNSIVCQSEWETECDAKDD